jgi:3'-phosphoadenosine 5'-phosphosulfate sulfotransferase (PAPS reductase)/FAD synthetase
MKHVVGFSGGIDSQATALWVRERFPAEDIILTNADPGGNESPITSDFLAHYSENVFPVTMIHPIVQDLFGRAPGAVAEAGLKPTDPLTFELLASLKGIFPSTKVRFCTTHLKLEPMRRWCWENGAKGLNEPRRRIDIEAHKIEWYRPYGEDPIENEGVLSDGYQRYSGVRRDESDSRSEVDESEFDDYFLCQLNRPLATWTKQQCFDYVIDHGEAFNSLYLMGFERVGCMLCINAKKRDILLTSAHFPDIIVKIRRWESSVGRTFFPPMIPTGKKFVPIEGEDPKLAKKRKRSESRRHGFIDEVIEWAKTTHGGKQYSLPLLAADAASGMCMSKYGLCE